MSDFRNKEKKNRAIHKDNEKSKITPVSHFVDKVKSGDTVWGYMCPQKGKLKNITVSIEISNKEEMDFMVETFTGKIKKEGKAVFKVGDNKLGYDIPIEEGDKFLLKARTIQDREFIASNVFISFNYITGKIK